MSASHDSHTCLLSLSLLLTKVLFPYPAPDIRREAALLVLRLSCSETVIRILLELEIEAISIELGEVKIKEQPSSNQLDQLAQKLKNNGFELLEDRN